MRNKRKSFDENAPNIKPLLLEKEVCDILRISRSTLFYLETPFILVGKRRRYRPEDIERFIQENKHQPRFIAARNRIIHNDWIKKKISDIKTRIELDEQLKKK